MRRLIILCDVHNARMHDRYIMAISIDALIIMEDFEQRYTKITISDPQEKNLFARSAKNTIQID